MQKKKKIIHVLNKIENCGNGIANVTFDLSCQQVQDGHDVYVVSGGGSFQADLMNNGVKHLTVNQDRKILNVFKALYAFNAHINRIRPDIVHCHVMTGLFLALLLKPFHRYHVVATVHNEYQRSSVFMKYADRVIAISQQVKEAMIKKGTMPFKLFVVKNGIIGTLRNNSFSKQTTPKLISPNIATVAGLFYRKGVDILIKGFIEIAGNNPDAQLYIIGEGSERKTLENLASSSGYASRIHFLGFQKDIKGLLDQVDIFVLPSRSEPFGLSLAEAREAGCAVIGSDVGGIPEVVNYGKAGHTFAVEDYKTLSVLLHELLSSPEKLALMKQNSKTDIEWLTVKRMTKEVEKVYDIQD